MQPRVVRLFWPPRAISSVRPRGSALVGESEVNLVLGTEGSTTVLRTCELQNGAGNHVTLTLSALVQGKLRQIVLTGEAARLGESQDFKGYVYDRLLDSQDDVRDAWLVGSFESISVTTLAIGDVFRGTLDIEGYAYSAKLDPGSVPSSSGSSGAPSFFAGDLPAQIPR